MTGLQLHDLLFHINVYHGVMSGYGELTEDVVMTELDGDPDDAGVGIRRVGTITKGTTVKINMASRFGDLGITRNMKLDHGYEWRVKPALLENCRLTKTNTLRIQESGWDWKIKVWSTDPSK